MTYDLTPSKDYAKQIGLIWLGDDYGPLLAVLADAERLNFTQEQLDAAMRHHLWQVKTLFTPSNYKFLGRLAIALYFLTGWKK